MGLSESNSVSCNHASDNKIGRPRSGSPISPDPELSFLPVLYRGWTRAGEKRVQGNLHAHAQNEPIKNYHAACVNVSRNAFYSSSSEKKKHFFDVDIVMKKQIEMWFIVVCTLIDNEYSSLIFSQI